MQINKENLKEWFELKGLSEKTMKNYFYYFNHFDLTRFADQDYIFKFVVRYKNNLVARAFIKNLKQFILSSNEISLESKEKLRSIELPKFTGRRKKRLPDVLTRPEVHRIADKTTNQRDRVMMLLNYYCGLRVGELVEIKTYNFNWAAWGIDKSKSGILTVIGKGDKQRKLPVLPELMDYIQDFIKSISENIDKEEPIFNIGIRRWEEIVSNCSKKGIDRRINPHLLRHSVATFLEEMGLSISEIAEFLGHESISTSQIYIHINKERLKSKVEAAFNKEDG